MRFRRFVPLVPLCLVLVPLTCGAQVATVYPVASPLTSPGHAGFWAVPVPVFPQSRAYYLAPQQYPTYPRVLWELGKQSGEWPRFR